MGNKVRVAAVDVVLGYPIQHEEDAEVRRGGGKRKTEMVGWREDEDILRARDTYYGILQERQTTTRKKPSRIKLPSWTRY